MLRLYLAALLLVSVITAVSNVVAMRSLAGILIEYRKDHAATIVVRESFLAAEDRQTAAMIKLAGENLRLSTLVCAQLTKAGKLHKPCPE